MIGNNLKKTTIWGGLFSALLLCGLMALMPFSGMVDNPASETDYTNESETAEEKEDPFHLPDQIEPTDWEYGLENELEGKRTLNQKAFVSDGEIKLLISSDPLHYINTDSGAWEDIDTNIVSTPFGWEVTENLFQTYFPADVGAGVTISLDQNVDPVVTGIAPQITTIREDGVSPHVYRAAPSHDAISVGGNVIRYPVAQDFDLDYEVSSIGVKQNLIIRSQPVVQEDDYWFGLTEMIRLPAGYALFIEDQMVENEILTTQDSMYIRNVETGDVLGIVPVPVVVEPGAEHPYTATFFVHMEHGLVSISTMVETSWLMDENRSFPLSLDPSVTRTSSAGGYCYVYYGYCYSQQYRYHYRYYASWYYLPWSKYDFTSSNALPSGATASAVKWKQYVQYHYTYASNTYNYAVKIMYKCGADVNYNYGVTTRSCNSNLLTALSAGTTGNVVQRRMISSAYNSPTVGSISQGTGWKTSTLSSSAATTIVNAANNAGTIGMSFAMHANSNYFYTYSNHGGSNNGYLEITYTGGTDSTPPSSSFVPYESTSYKEGARTFFTTLSDAADVDTTSAGKPHLYYSVNGGSYTKVGATSIGQIAGSTDYRFRATTASISAGDSVDYYWAFQDLAVAAGMANSNNFGTDPAGGGGTPNSATPPSNPYNFEVDDPANAGTARKFTLLQTDTYAGNYFTPNKFFDRQMTYYDDSNEYVFEFDTSDCGTGGANGCFYTLSDTFYNNMMIKWATAPTNGYNGLGGTVSGTQNLHKSDGGYLTMSAQHGPGMNLIMHYDSTMNSWGMVGLGTSTGIDEPLSGGTASTQRSTYGYTKAYNVEIPGDITGTFGKFDFNGTYSSSKANWMCVSSNGWYYFFRSTSSNPLCTSGYYYIYQTNYVWSGFALFSGYYGRMANSGTVTSKVGKVAPEPDTSPPIIDHSTLADSHSTKRTFAFGIGDAGDPPTGLNTSSAAGVGPTLYYTITDADGTVGSQQTKVLTPSDTRSACELKECVWAATVSDLPRGGSVAYNMRAEDTSAAGSGTSYGANVVTTASNSFDIGDPNKVFVIEWHDIGFNYQYTCNVQVKLYDVTNEIEFHYDPDCEAYYDYATVGYQDQTRTKGATLRAELAYMGNTAKGVGGNPHDVNYRIHTSSSDHGSEEFETGSFNPITNYQTAISGTSNGNPYVYYCSVTAYYSQYQHQCDANIDVPDDFSFEYFGTTYDGQSASSRLMISRFAGMYFKSTSSTAPERAMTTWYANMPDLPYNGNVASRPGLIAPWWGAYTSYYCYDNSNADCSVRYRTMPFEGKGTDIDADINSDTSWDVVDSPIRINPSGDYLSVNANLAIQEGVVVQIAQGKGISFDGACGGFTVNGGDGLNATTGADRGVLFEGQYGQTWKGLAFTNSCTTAAGTDDRHSFKHATFANTTDYAISAGSRHGSSPSSNANVGNFTMQGVAFNNVKGAVSHGSGQGTGFSITDFAVNDADESCFNFPGSSVVSLTEGEMDGCNSGSSSGHGAVTSDTGSGGSLFMENVTVADAYKNLVNVHLADVTMNNITATGGSGNFLVHSGSGHLGMNNVVSSGYSTGSSSATTFVLETVTTDASLSFTPAGASATSAGPSGDDATLSDVTAGGLSVARSAVSLADVDTGSGDIILSGNSPSANRHTWSDISAGGISVSGCGYNLAITNVALSDASDTAYVSSSCSTSSAPNTVIVDGGTIDSGSSSNNILYARNSVITVGNVDITGQTAQGNNVALASTNGIITFIAVTWRGNDCADEDGWVEADCWVAISSSSGQINFGGKGTAYTYRQATPTDPYSYKSGTTVTTYALNSAATAKTYSVNSGLTDANGAAEVWVITEELSGSSLTSTSVTGAYFDASGPGGIGDELNATFGPGDEIYIKLEQPPIYLSDSGMDCAYLTTNTDVTNKTVESGVYLMDEASIMIFDDLTLDGCTLILTMGSKFIVSADATIQPVLTISNGGSLVLESSSELTSADGTINQYRAHVVLADGGTLSLDDSSFSDIYQDSSAGGALIVGKGATLNMINGSVGYGNDASDEDMATILVDKGSFTGSSMSVINSGGTGTGVWYFQAQSTVSDLTVSNAYRGIMSSNAAPMVNGYTLTNNEIGLEFFGGMALPTIYRSTLLSGESTGWTTHAIDLTTQVQSGKRYLQMGYESIYGGGNAHPLYNYATNGYYMLSDRIRYEVTLDDGTVFNYSYDQAGRDSAGYWNDQTSANKAYGGWGKYDCNYYGYSRLNPEYNYYYYQANFGPWGSNGYYDAPDDFGFRWEDSGKLDGVMYYPYHYWGYYYTSYHGGNGVFKPPQGYTGYQNNYNICLDYVYLSPSYGTGPGIGARVAMPILDLQNQGTNSGTSGTITGVTLYMDVLHNRADYYLDRFDFQARMSNDHDDMGDWARESGTPTFTDGLITGADVGIKMGGASAASEITNVTVSSPTDSGLKITGPVSSTVDELKVTGGNYGVLNTLTGRGKVNLNNFVLTNQASAGINILNDISGSMAGTITGSAGAAMSYGSKTTTDLEFTGLNLATNAIGIATAGQGDIDLYDSAFGNTVDFSISGGSTVTFVDGTVDVDSIDVTGGGVFNRARSLQATVTADGDGIAADHSVYLMNSGGKVTGVGITDSNGVAEGLQYYTSVVTKNGVTAQNLAGYKLGTVALVGTYDTQNGDFRYYYDSVTLDANAATMESVALTDRFDSRICYFASDAYEQVAGCAGNMNTAGSRTLSCGTGCSITEYGYYGAVASDMSGQTIMMDAAFMYVKGDINSVVNEWNDTLVFNTGSYDFYGTARWASTSPYNAKWYVENSTFIAMSGMKDNGDMNGMEFGYYAWSDINPWFVNNTMIGVASISAANENSNWMPDHFKVVDNLIISSTAPTVGASSFAYNDMCINIGGVNDALISGNTFIDCSIGVRPANMPYYTGFSSSEWGADDAVIEGNEFNNGVLDVWFALGCYCDDNIVRDNVAQGATLSEYSIYAQDANTVSPVITGNTISSSKEPIYLRGALDYTINDNNIVGEGNSAWAGIYTKDGYGEIDGNTLVDADAGILIDGVRYGYDVSVTNNIIGASTGRTAVGAVGIWGEDCGSSTLFTGGNDITVMANAIVADGCDIVDTASDLKGTGGQGGTVWTVNMMASYFTPQNVTITEGDIVRWRLQEYSPLTNYQHSTVSDDTSGGVPLWDSGLLNLGGSYTKQFNTAGTYDYHCGAHSSMTGKITVEAAGSGSSTYYSTGFDVRGGNDDIELDGTSISGFTTAYEQTGGSLHLTGSASLSGDDYGADLDGVDTSSDGASLTTASATGVGMYFTGGASLDLKDLSTDSARGVHIDGETNGEFNWNGGTVSSGTALYAEDKAIGDIQNMTWTDAEIQIHAGANTKITSVGNTLDTNKMSVSSTGEVYEANLLDLDVTHSGAAIDNVGLLIQSESGSNVAHVSPDMRSDLITVGSDNGDLSDWTGNSDNPSDDAFPGVVSSDGEAGQDFMVTWDETNLYLALSGADMDDGELLIFIDSSSQGSTEGWEWDGTTPSFNFAADYAFFAEDGSDSPNDGDSTYSWGLKKFSDPNWLPETCQNMAAFIGYTDNTNTEIKIPWSCIGGPGAGDKIRLNAVVLGEDDGTIASTHPSTGHVKLIMGQGSLGDGTMDDKRLNYREYINSNIPSASEDYEVTVKVQAPDGCDDDWGVITGLDMSVNREESIDILRACPVIIGIEDVVVDEDSGAYTISLTDKADDLQDAEASLSWTYVDDYDSNEGTLLTVTLSGHDLVITPLDDQFGTYLIELTVEDSHGLTDSHTFMVTVNNVNDAPTICNTARSDCMPVFSDDGFDNLNVLDENWGSHSKPLGSTASAAYIIDKDNEQTQTLSNAEDVPQIYTWNASVPSDCLAFTVEVVQNELFITEIFSNELGGVCNITLTLSDGASENDAATAVDVAFTINPTNDIPVIPAYDVSGDSHITNGNGDKIATPWAVTVTEDTGCTNGACVNTNELTFNLTNMKTDDDHVDADLVWTWEEITGSCDVNKYFENIVITGDHIAFTLIQDATTNAPPEEKDYLDDDGIHQEPPQTLDEYCAIKLTLWDTLDAPSYVPNYALDTAHYQQQSITKTFKIKVDNTREMVADYLFDINEGISFNNVNFIMPGTHVPVSVDIKHEGDVGPYKYDQLLKVSFLSNGADGLSLRDTYYAEPPADGLSDTFDSKVLVEESTTRVGVRVDVMTCKAASCPSPSAATPSDFITNSPAAHRAEASLSPWSSPGTIGYSATDDVYSKRRPALEDQDWLNNVMFTSVIDSDPDGILDSEDTLPVMVDTISPASVPSFAPGFAAISAAGLFVAGLMLASRRREEEEELESLSLVDDEQAVSPVIATILMVAITVVLSGVVYVWASDLADQPSKSVPRIAFKVEKNSPGLNGYWSIIVTSAKEPIATQATVVMLEWVNGSGSQLESFRLDNTEGIYGFAPINSESFVTFSDSIECDSPSECTSTYGDGDAIHIKMSDESGYLLDDGIRVTLKYVPIGAGNAFVLKTFNLEI